ncbi:MAG: glycosyltransferase family 4 protein [Thermoleophilia bacterium]
MPPDAIRVHVVDMPAWTPPYDHALCAGLARAGADVELVTTYFPFGPVPRGDGYRVSESFYRYSARLYRPARGYLDTLPSGIGDRLRRGVKMVEHLPDSLRYRRHAREADILHYQWLSSEGVDVHLLPRSQPLVLTAHDIVPRTPRRGDVSAMPRLLEKMDAVVVHSEHGAQRLRSELGVDPARVHVIEHGAFEYLTRLPREEPLPPEFAAVDKPVILSFGLIRPYKGVDLLLDAFADVPDAELWVVGMPHMDLEPLRELAERAPGTVRFVPRFVEEHEIPAYFRRADIVVLPYREIDQSGVLYTALAFGKALVLSAVGGFEEVAAGGTVARTVPPGDRDALAAALAQLAGDPAQRAQLERAAARAAGERYSWDSVAERTLALYRQLLASR